MRAVIQRVDHASVTVNGDVTGRIETGLVVLLGVTHGDSASEAEILAAKIVDLRVFGDVGDRRSLRDVDGSMLVVSQFTLYGTTRKGRRPSFTGAAGREVAEPLVTEFVEVVRGEGIVAETGQFGALMQLELRNNGPFTLVIDAVDGRIVA